MRSSVWIAATAGFCLVIGCSKGNTPDGKPNVNNGGQAQGDASTAPPDVALPPAQTPTVASEIGGQLEIDLPRSAATDAVPLPWQPQVPGAKTARVWTQPTVVIGRRQIFVGDKPIGMVTCAAAEPGMCDPAAFSGPTGKQRFDLEATALDGAGQLTALASMAAAQGWSGKPVLVLADRRLAYHAVDAVARTLAKAGAQPVLTAATDKGELVRVLPNANAALALYPAGPAVPCATNAQPGSADGGVPEDVSGVVIHVSAGGMGLELQRKGHESAGRELIGHLGAALSEWARRVRSAAPSIDKATVLVDPGAPWEEAVRAADAIRDTCAVLDAGAICHARQALFPHIELLLDPDAAPNPLPPGTPTAPATPAPQPPAPAPNLGLALPRPQLQRGDLMRRDAPLQRIDQQLPRPAPAPEAR